MRKFLLVPFIGLAMVSCNHDTSDAYSFNRVPEKSVNHYSFNEAMNRDRDGYSFSRTPVGQSTEASADWAITLKVKNAVLMDTTISAWANLVNVKTDNGVVTLTGSLPSREDIDKVVRKVKDVQGVKRVINNMTVAK